MSERNGGVVSPELAAAQAEAAAKKYYEDEVAMKRAVIDSICNFVYLYGGRMSVSVDVVANDVKHENGQTAQRQVWVEKATVTTSKE